MDRNTVKLVVTFGVKTLVSVTLFFLISIISIVKGICKFLYESWMEGCTREQEKTEKECKFWCLIKSLSRHESDLALNEKFPSLDNDTSSSTSYKNDNDITMVDSLSPLSPPSAPPSHITMRKDALSVSSLLDAANQLENSRKNRRKKENVVIEKPTTKIFQIPGHIVSSLIGKNGNHIKEIENKSHTRITIGLESDWNRSDCGGNNVDQKNDVSRKNNNIDDSLQVHNDGDTDDDSNNNHTVCRIKGKLTDISIAQGLIKTYIDENPAPVKVTKEIIIPRSIVGFIIGKQGANRKYIQNKAKAKFSVQSPKVKSTVTSISLLSASTSVSTTTTTPENNDDEWEDFTSPLKNEGKENGHGVLEEPVSVIVVKGVQEAVDKAESMIMDIVKSHSAHSGNSSKKKRQRYNPNNQHHNFTDDPNSSSSSSSHGTSDNFSMSNSVNANKFGRLKNPHHHRNHKIQNNSKNNNNNKDNLQGMIVEEEDWEPVVNNNNNNTSTSNGNDNSNSSAKAMNNNFGTTTGMKKDNVLSFTNIQPNSNPINFNNITFTNHQECLPSSNEMDSGKRNNSSPYQYFPNGRGTFMRTPQNQQYIQPRFPTTNPHGLMQNNFYNSPRPRFDPPHDIQYPSYLRFDSRQGNLSHNPYKWVATNNNTTTSTQQQQQQQQASSPNCSQPSQN